VTDLVLLAAVVGASARAGWDIGLRWTLLACGVALFVVADSMYAVNNLHSDYVIGNWYELGWSGGILLMSLASWHPARRQSHTQGLRHLTTSAAFALVALAVLAFGTVGAVALVASGLAVVALLALLGRLIVTLRENVGMLHSSQIEALTDPLTGLGNRRSLTREIDARLREPTGRSFSHCSTSTASRATTTPSATRRATRCWSASGAGFACTSATTASHSGWAATSSACSKTRRRTTRRRLAPLRLKP
jgi:hypothetical protein